MALKLKLPGAFTTGHHEENLMLCHKWLARTGRFDIVFRSTLLTQTLLTHHYVIEKTWLLIFDNAGKTPQYCNVTI